MRSTRLTPADADAVKARLESLDVLAGVLGVSPPSASGGVMRCPFHDDKTPSFSLFRSDSGGWAGRCHGCGIKGDALALAGHALGIEAKGRYWDLIEELLVRLGMVPGARPVPRLQTAPREGREAAREGLAERYSVQAQIHRILLEICPLGAEGRAYLHLRGLGPDDIPSDLCLLPMDQRRLVEAIKGEIGRDAWRELSGLASRDGLRFTHPANRLVIPWRGGPGILADVAVLQRRRIDLVKAIEGEIGRDAWRETGDGSKYVLPAGVPIPWLYGIEAAEGADESTTLFIVEGALDVLAVRALARDAGKNVWALGMPGAGAWRADWTAAAQGRDVIVGLDADAAGDNSVPGIMLDFKTAGSNVKAEAPTSPAKDWAEQLVATREKEEDDFFN